MGWDVQKILTIAEYLKFKNIEIESNGLFHSSANNRHCLWNPYVFADNAIDLQLRFELSVTCDKDGMYSVSNGRGIVYNTFFKTREMFMEAVTNAVYELVTKDRI